MTKLAAELIVAQNAKSLIIRAAGTFDWYSQNNFFWFVAKRLGAGKNINAAQDTFYTPIWAQDLSTAIVRAIRANMSGILHLAGADRVSRYDFALLVARELMLAQMSAIPTMQSSLPWRAKRPTDSSLNSVECYRKLNLSPPGLPDAIKRCSEEMHEAYRLTR